jgi:integrase
MARRGHGEGSIYQRSDGRWAASISLEGGKRKTFYGKTRKEVQAQLKTALYDQQQGKLMTAPRQTVQQFLTHWLEDVHKPAVRIRTYVRYEMQLRRHVLPALGGIQLSKLTVQHVQKFYSQTLQKGLSPQSVRLLHAMLHKAFDYAVRVDLLPRNVCDNVSLPRIEKRETRALSLEQALRLIETVRGHRMEALFVLALVTGMRRGEIIGLKWSDVNFTEGVISIQRSLVELKGGIIESKPKSTRGYRSILLPPFALEALKKHRERQERMRQGALKWQENDYVFCTSHGTPIAAANLRTAFKALLVKAELPDIRFHDLRHSVATLLLEIGTHPKIVQELLGHENIGMTMDIYSHVMPTMQREAMAKLNELLGGSQHKDGGSTERGEGEEEEHA